jgi:LAO/AO transport system kinase
LPDIQQLLAAAIGGERTALARLLSVIERADRNLLPIESHLAPLVGNALIIGITGPPGAGKSTLINRLIPQALKSFDRVAVLAIDPSSPFSQGALLGDRIRMQGGELGEKVFIRSMASRGEAGGLARATSTAVRLFDACQWPLVIIETLGIGQVELNVMNLADTVLVVLNPGWGDEIQANKAGLTEAGDVFAINKADKPGAEQTRIDLVNSVSLIASKPLPEIVATIATSDEGIAELWQAITAHQTRLLTNGQLEQRRHDRQGYMTRRIIADQVSRVMDDALDSDEAAAILSKSTIGEIDMHKALATVLALMADKAGS